LKRNATASAPAVLPTCGWRHADETYENKEAHSAHTHKHKNEQTGEHDNFREERGELRQGEREQRKKDGIRTNPNNQPKLQLPEDQLALETLQHQEWEHDIDLRGEDGGNE
jgi:hypothetical protein